MNATEIKPGRLYRLTQTVQNPTPDRRHRYDWRAHTEWEAGTEFRTKSFTIHNSVVKREGIEVCELKRGSYGVTTGSQAFDLLAPHLEEIEAGRDFVQDGVRVTFDGNGRATFAAPNDSYVGVSFDSEWTHEQCLTLAIHVAQAVARIDRNKGPQS